MHRKQKKKKIIGEPEATVLETIYYARTEKLIEENQV